MLSGLVVFSAIVAVIFAFATIYNSLVAAAEKATRAWTDLDTLLHQRHEEIPRIVELCEPYLSRERVLVDRLLEARAAVFAARQTRDADALGRAEAQLRAATVALMTRAAAQPELVESPIFNRARQRQQSLDLELKSVLDRYNDAVRDYNAAIRRAPGKVVALVAAFPPLRSLDFGSASS
jgi:LemA protein